VSAPVLVLENVNLEKLERLVYSRQYEEAFRELRVALNQLRAGGEFVGYPLEEEWRLSLYTRLAGAITALLADPGCKLSVEGFAVLAPFHPIVSAVLQISGYENADHIAKLVGELRDDKIDWKGQFSVLKMLVCYTLDSQIELDLVSLFRGNVNSLFPLWLGMVAHGINLMPEDERRHTDLMKLAPIFSKVEVTEQYLSAITEGYMHCSYSTSPDRHEIKKVYNKMLSGMFKQIELPKVERVMRDRPVVLVLLERFCTTHAMFRVYGNAIRTLREKFEVHAIVAQNEIDDEAKALFDSVDTIDGGNVSLDGLVAKARAIGPDIVYYPSVGMATWAVALSSVRLAPIQIMSPGHPATTNSEAMDYLIVDEWWKPGWNTWSETVIVKPGANFAIPSDARFPKKNLDVVNPRVRIAVPSMICKFNAKFLSCCKRIYERTGCQFEFIPNMIGVSHYYAKSRILKWIPSANVWPRYEFNDYVAKMAECDLILSTFPFGGTNSTFDALKVGLPVVTLKNKEVFGRTDAGLIRAAGLPDYLICSSEEQYEKVAADLIVNRDKLADLSRFLFDAKLEENLHDGEAKMSDVFEWLYQNHETIKASGKKYLKAFQRKDLHDQQEETA